MPRTNKAAKYETQVKYLCDTRDNPRLSPKMRFMAAMSYGKLMERLDGYSESANRRREKRALEKGYETFTEEMLLHASQQPMDPAAQQAAQEAAEDDHIQSVFAHIGSNTKLEGDNGADTTD